MVRVGLGRVRGTTTPSPSPISSLVRLVVASCARDANNVSCKRQELGTSRCETTEDAAAASAVFSLTNLNQHQNGAVWNSATWIFFILGGDEMVLE